MTGQERDYEAILSRVLHTTTDQLEPVGDGLTKIRERLSEPWLKRQWLLLRSELMVLRWLVVVRCESVFSRFRSRSGVTDLTPDATAGQEADGGPLKSLLSIATLTTTTGKRPRRSVGPAMAWLRPALAVAGAVVLVVAGVFALGQIREGLFFGLENATGTNSSTAGQQHNSGNADGSGSKIPGSGSSSKGGSRAPSSGASAGHNKAGPSGTPCPAASPPQSSPSPAASPTSASPSPSPTSPSPSPSPTSPSPSQSTSQAPLTGVIPGHSPQEAIGTTALVMCEQTPGSAPRSPATATP
jgi:hypothetical protein